MRGVSLLTPMPTGLSNTKLNTRRLKIFAENEVRFGSPASQGSVKFRSKSNSRSPIWVSKPIRWLLPPRFCCWKLNVPNKPVAELKPAPAAMEPVFRSFTLSCTTTLSGSLPGAKETLRSSNKPKPKTRCISACRALRFRGSPCFIRSSRVMINGRV